MEAQEEERIRRIAAEQGLVSVDDLNAPGGPWERAEALRVNVFANSEHSFDRRQRLARRVLTVARMSDELYAAHVAKADAVRALRRAECDAYVRPDAE